MDYKQVFCQICLTCAITSTVDLSPCQFLSASQELLETPLIAFKIAYKMDD